MTIQAPYKAFWVPGLKEDVDPDEALTIALDWLQGQVLPGLLVMHAVKMVSNRPLLAWAAGRYPVVSPRSRQRPSPTSLNAVLAVWVSPSALELAEQLAQGGALCVISGGLYDITPWIRRSGAKSLIDLEAEPPSPTDLHPEVVHALDMMIGFDGHNGWLGAGGKEDAVRRFRELTASGHRPAPVDVETYVLSSSEVDHRGAARLRGLYEKILAGRQLRDYRGRNI